MTIILIPLLYEYLTSKENIFGVGWLLLFFIVVQISNYYSYLNAAHRNYDSMLFEKSVKTIMIIVSFILYSKFFDAILALIFSYITQSIMHILYIYITSPHIFFIRGNICSNKKVYYGFLKNYIFSTLTSFFGSIGIYLSAVIMFQLYNDNAFLADYQVVAKSVFFSLVTVFVHPVSAYTFPELAKFISQGKYDKIKNIDRQLKRYLIVFFGLLFLLMPFSKLLIGIIFPETYKESYLALNIMLPMLPFIIYTSFSINILKGFNYFVLALYVRLVGTVLFVGSIYIFYYFGVNSISIVYSLDISFVGMFLLAYIYKNRLSR
jgi:O-antigen/teichoic acid export membrane protein